MITAWRNITLDGAEWENHLKFSMVDSLWQTIFDVLSIILSRFGEYFY